MRKVEPQVFLIAETQFDNMEFLQYLKSIGQAQWKSDSESSSDMLVEVAGRLCYRSWEPYSEEANQTGVNPNVVRVREGNEEYISNLLKQLHGSVLEHANLSFLFKDVSRVFTHELVRHRAGMGYSQESLRFVRLTDLGFWVPPDVNAIPEMAALYERTVNQLEEVQRQLVEILERSSGMKMNEMPMHDRKQWTSRFRRLAPIGLATAILATGNLRAWRHIFTMRSSKGAEEEIRLVQEQLAPLLKQTAPSCFSDLHLIATEEGPLWKFAGNPTHGI